MRTNGERNRPSDRSIDNEMNLLYEIDRQPDTSQRTLSRRVGIALGLANILIHKLAEQGYIRVSQASWKRWIYTLTPAGIVHKTKLTLSYIKRFLGHYRQVRHMIREELATLELNPESRIAVCGTDISSELVFLALREIGIDEIDFFANDPAPGSRFVGLPIYDVSALQPDKYDKVLVVNFDGPSMNFDHLDIDSISLSKMETLFSGMSQVEGQNEG